MAELKYADLADLEPFLTEDEFGDLDADGALPGLLHASQLVRMATHNDFYQADDDGYPINERKRDAMRSATAAQVAFWVKAKVDLATLALEDANATPSVKSSSINGATVQVDTSTADAVLLASRKGLVTRAMFYLKNAGLASNLIGRIYG